MDNVWNTIGTILATGAVIYGGYLLRDYLQSKREARKEKLEKEYEIRDAKRKYRENLVSPIREALMEIQTKLVMRSMWEFATKGNEHGPYYSLLDRASLEKFEEVIVQTESADTVETMTKRLPLVYQISNQETREFIELLIFKFAAMKREEKEKLTMEYWDREFSLAYKKLEDYVALAD